MKKITLFIGALSAILIFSVFPLFAGKAQAFSFAVIGDTQKYISTADKNQQYKTQSYFWKPGFEK